MQSEWVPYMYVQGVGVFNRMKYTRIFSRSSSVMTSLWATGFSSPSRFSCFSLPSRTAYSPLIFDVVHNIEVALVTELAKECRMKTHKAIGLVWLAIMTAGPNVQTSQKLTMFGFSCSSPKTAWNWWTREMLPLPWTNCSWTQRSSQALYVL